MGLKNLMAIISQFEVLFFMPVYKLCQSNYTLFNILRTLDKPALHHVKQSQF